MIGRADRDEPAAARRRAVDLLQPGFEADRRPGRSRDGRDLGGRHGAPGRAAARDRRARTWRTAIFAEGGRTLIASDDSGSVSMVDVETGRPIGPPLVGRRRGRRLAGSQPGRTAAGRGVVRRVGLRVGHEDRRAVRLPADGRHEPGQRRRVQPRRPDPRELAPALGGRLEHERRPGDRRAAGRTDRPDHRRGLQPRRHAARRGAVRRRARSCTTRRPDDRLSGSTATRSSPQSPSTPTGSLIAVGTIDGKVRFFDPKSGAAVGSPLDSGKRGGLAGRLQPGRPAARGGRRTRTASDGFYDQQRQGEVQLWDVDSRTSRRAGDRAGRRIGALRRVQPGRHAAGDRQLLRAARPVGRGHPDPPRQADASGGRRRPERRVRSERPARRRRRSDRTGAGVARGRSAAGVSAPRRPHRPRHRGRPSTRPARSSRPRACSAGPGCGTRRRVSATATSWSEARGPTRSRRPSTFRSSGCGTRSARTASCWPSRESTSTRDAVGRRPGGLAPARVRDRRPEPDPRGVEALPAAGDALSRDVLGVARRLNSVVRPGPTLAERSETVPFAQRPSSARGIVPRRSRPAPCFLMQKRSRSEVCDETQPAIHPRAPLSSARWSSRRLRSAPAEWPGRTRRPSRTRAISTGSGWSRSPRAAPTRWR